MAESPYLFFRSVLRICSYFNPRTPVGCDRMSRLPRVVPRYFNPRTPVGCDRLLQPVLHVEAISIHAPQWGATRRCLRWDSNPTEFQSTHPSGVRLCRTPCHACCLRISIHAPQWGATQPTPCSLLGSVYFNPRTPVGCDGIAVVRGLLRLISIHAPQWGATNTSAMTS